MSGLIATKLGMSRIFSEEGKATPVTYLQVEPNMTVRLKTEEKDGYNAIVLGCNAKTRKHRNGNEVTKYRTQREWKVETLEGCKAGNMMDVSAIPEEAKVTVTGISKGRGFQGVIKRHGFSRGPETHGSHHHRRPGSVGMCEFPGRVLKGKKMPGHMGNAQVTLQHRPVMLVDKEKNIFAVKGAVPGPNGRTVFVTIEK